MPQEGFLFSGIGAREHRVRPPRRDRSTRCAPRPWRSAPHEFIEALPTATTPRSRSAASRLSIGQRQLVAFARALLADPRILILDEATSSVDIPTEARIEEALETLLRDRTAFVVAHRLSTIRRADMIVVLEHGEVIEAGTHGQLIARRGPLLLAVRRLGRGRRLTRSGCALDSFLTQARAAAVDDGT